MNSLQRTIARDRMRVADRLIRRGERRIADSYWERTGWYWVYHVLRKLNMIRMAWVLLPTARAIRVRYVRFIGRREYVIWDVETAERKTPVLVVESKALSALRARIAENRKALMPITTPKQQP
jgi:hypothetical protein